MPELSARMSYRGHRGGVVHTILCQESIKTLPLMKVIHHSWKYMWRNGKCSRLVIFKHFMFLHLQVINFHFNILFNTSRPKKWPPFSRHFQLPFVEIKVSYLKSSFIEVPSKGSNWQSFCLVYLWLGVLESTNNPLPKLMLTKMPDTICHY